jgi:hypothetical protein
MLDMAEIPTYRIHTSGSPGEAELLAVHRLSRKQAETALRLYAAREKAVVGTMLGVSIDGVIFTPVAGWQPDTLTSDGFTDITIVLWLTIRDLLASISDDEQ